MTFRKFAQNYLPTGVTTEQFQRHNVHQYVCTLVFQQ